MTKTIIRSPVPVQKKIFIGISFIGQTVVPRSAGTTAMGNFWGTVTHLTRLQKRGENGAINSKTMLFVGHLSHGE
jgi:hypothetical protein